MSDVVKVSLVFEIISRVKEEDGSIMYLCKNKYKRSIKFNQAKVEELVANGQILNPELIVETKPENNELIVTDDIYDVRTVMEARGRKVIDYDKTVTKLIEKYNNFAYTLSETTTLRDASIPLTLNIIGKKAGKICCYIAKWNNDDKDYFWISESTLELLEYEYTSLVKRVNEPFPNGKIPHNYYHEVVIKMALFSRVPQFKKLKLIYKRINEAVFDNKCRRSLAMVVGNYVEGTDFEDLHGCGGYYSTDRNMILINAKSHSLNGIDRMDENNIRFSLVSTIIHEMAHDYAYIVYGSTWEDEANDNYYNLDKNKHGIQTRCHGKKFGDAVRLAAARTGIAFDYIFNYNIHLDNTWNTALTKKVLPFVALEPNNAYTYASDREVKHFPCLYAEVIDENKESILDVIKNRTHFDAIIDTNIAGKNDKILDGAVINDEKCGYNIDSDNIVNAASIIIDTGIDKIKYWNIIKISNKGSRYQNMKVLIAKSFRDERLKLLELYDLSTITRKSNDEIKKNIKKELPNIIKAIAKDIATIV